jgi:outer membrane protein assembly factor BamE (lipoprotein component of BamABCDE complex)
MSCSQLINIPSRKEDAQKMTLGFIQSKVKKGISSEEVIMLLGTPNIITSSDNNSETWIYDKISTETEKSSFFSDEISVKSSRSLIVVIKFDSNKKVISSQYRQTAY